MAISWSVLSVLQQLNIRARRTIRFVAWSCEEEGGIGINHFEFSLLFFLLLGIQEDSRLKKNS
jgi:Zn-dependent M28 family amino/carboxypeptidase